MAASRDGKALTAAMALVVADSAIEQVTDLLLDMNSPHDPQWIAGVRAAHARLTTWRGRIQAEGKRAS